MRAMRSRFCHLTQAALVAGIAAQRRRFVHRASLRCEDAEARQRADLVYQIQTGDVPAVLRGLAADGGEGSAVDAPLTSLGQTALHIACGSGALPLVQALLKAGADPNLRDRTGASCVALCCAAGHAHVLQKLLEVPVRVATYDVAGLTPLHKAVGFGQPDCLRRLLEHGLDPNLLTGEVTLPPDYGAAPSRYETALHIAARLLTRAINSPQGAGSSERQQLQQREIMKILVSFGADPMAKDLNGDTPLHWCARTGDAWGLWLLLGHTPSPQAALLSCNKLGEDVWGAIDSWPARLVAYAALLRPLPALR
ncbi:unnamed protein product [Effrenium voratum]|nr:unnamed protein product [Effrenium voratum]